MNFFWFVLFAVAALLMKENSCVPAIRPLSQRGILFPVDNWDDCFIDEASTRPGMCKRIEECTEALKKWDKESVYPKTCYFIKQQQFVCCPITATKETFTSTENLDNIFNKNAVSTTTTPSNIFDIFDTSVEGLFTKIPDGPTTTKKRPSNIFLGNLNKSTTTSSPNEGIFTLWPDATKTTKKRPSNIFLDNLNKSITTSSPNEGIFTQKPVDTTTTKKKPSNIFLENLHQSTTPATSRPSNIFLDNVEKTTSQKPPPSAIPDIFNTQKPSIPKRRSELECEYQNQSKFGTIDINGRTYDLDEFPFMAFLVWKQNEDYEVWYPCSGVLISPRFVLTAAHCADIGGESPSFVNFGDKNVTGSLEGTYHIKRIIEYPGYDPTTIYNNIALVELEEEVNKPLACIWTQHDLPTSQVNTLGYGLTSFDGLKLIQLYKVPLTVIDKEQCKNYYRLVDALLCTGNVENLNNSCQPDTGGPLIMESEETFYVVGLTAFGLPCSDLPSVYTRVSSYINWIEQIVWPKIDVRFDRK